MSPTHHLAAQHTHTHAPPPMPASREISRLLLPVARLLLPKLGRSSGPLKVIRGRLPLAQRDAHAALGLAVGVVKVQARVPLVDADLPDGRVRHAPASLGRVDAVLAPVGDEASVAVAQQRRAVLVDVHVLGYYPYVSDGTGWRRSPNPRQLMGIWGILLSWLVHSDIRLTGVHDCETRPRVFVAARVSSDISLLAKVGVGEGLRTACCPNLSGMPGYS